MRVLGIDPGNVRSAAVALNGSRVEQTFYEPNHAMCNIIPVIIQKGLVDVVACEMIASYGMPVSRTVFDTCVWIGTFRQIAEQELVPCYLVTRMVCKMQICHDSRAKDANIRQALIDAYPPTGGGKTPQIGTKAQPGPLYGMKGDLWAALAVATTFRDLGEDCAYDLSGVDQ